ncbi:hypothetical protein RhiirA4_394514 [Rhizophagus irregularis]|uniref:Uncharacterized protein n=1 Tax=Rhizophagus irregularis TaxID=588596 RepID=A0A2I1G134_9GLOM|nr:hypothetical protein RhiirA4_394514 [Rhizophagus irregularis]
MTFGEEFDYLYGIITTATEWYFLLYTSESISCTSETEYHISLTKAIAKEENEAELRKNRAGVGKEPKKKKARVQECLKKE